MTFDSAAQNCPVSVVNADDIAIISRKSHPNALLIGSPEFVDAAIAMLQPCLERPIIHCDPCAGAGALFVVERGTLVIRNVERLDRYEQHQLLDFIDDRNGAVRVIAASQNDVFQCVQHGDFLQALYYRLNTVLIHADTALSESWLPQTPP